MDLVRERVDLGKKPGLILVDMINGFTDSACALGTDCPDVVAANKTLLDAWRAKGLPVYFTTVVFHHENQAKVFRQRVDALNVLTPDSHWVKVDSALEPIEGETLIEKRWASSFFKTDLDERMRAEGCDSAVVTGLTTSGCVRATVVDALQSDYPTWVPEEAVGDRNPDAHKANLFDMNAKYAEVVKMDEVLSHLKTI